MEAATSNAAAAAAAVDRDLTHFRCAGGSDTVDGTNIDTKAEADLGAAFHGVLRTGTWPSVMVSRAIFIRFETCMETAVDWDVFIPSCIHTS